MRKLRRLELGWILLCLFFLGYGASLVWKSERSVPAAYRALRSRGIPATAQLVACGPGHGHHGTDCRLSLDYRGQTRSWIYPEDSPQFEHLQPGASVSVLVDPGHPATVYTVHDVDRGTNTGITSPVLWYGVVLICIGLAGLAGLLWFVRPAR
jgi:hypothetical protein